MGPPRCSARPTSPSTRPRAPGRAGGADTSRDCTWPLSTGSRYGPSWSGRSPRARSRCATSRSSSCAVARWSAWRRSCAGAIPGAAWWRPADFIHVAEETGLVVPLGSWVLNCALADLARWRAKSAPGTAVTMSVNVSALQVRDPGFLDTLVGSARPVGRPGGVARAGDHGDGAARRRRAGLRRPGRAARARPAHRHRRLRHRLLVAGLPPAARHRRPEDRPVLHQRDRERRADRPRSSERSCTSPRRSTCASSPRAWRPPRSATPCSGRAAVWVRGTSSRLRYPADRDRPVAARPRTRRAPPATSKCRPHPVRNGGPAVHHRTAVASLSPLAVAPLR